MLITLTIVLVIALIFGKITFKEVKEHVRKYTEKRSIKKGEQAIMPMPPGLCSNRWAGTVGFPRCRIAWACRAGCWKLCKGMRLLRRGLLILKKITRNFSAASRSSNAVYSFRMKRATIPLTALWYTATAGTSKIRFWGCMPPVPCPIL